MPGLKRAPRPLYVICGVLRAPILRLCHLGDQGAALPGCAALLVDIARDLVRAVGTPGLVSMKGAVGRRGLWVAPPRHFGKQWTWPCELAAKHISITWVPFPSVLALALRNVTIPPHPLRRAVPGVTRAGRGRSGPGGRERLPSRRETARTVRDGKISTEQRGVICTPRRTGSGVLERLDGNHRPIASSRLQ